MGQSAQKREAASYEDLRAVPDTEHAELIGGELHTAPRPSPRHALVSSVLGEELGPPFRRGRGGPGGWVFLDEPELHLGDDVLVPHLAGWRRERLPQIPRDAAYLTISPDFVCEVPSPSTQRRDRVLKPPIFHREGVGHVWLIDPIAQTLEVYRLDGDSYRVAGTYGGTAPVRVEPFEAIELELAALWDEG